VYRDTKVPGRGVYLASVEILSGVVTIDPSVSLIDTDINTFLYSMDNFDADYAAFFYEESVNNRPMVRVVNRSRAAGTPFELDTGSFTPAANRGQSMMIAIDDTTGVAVWFSGGMKMRAFRRTALEITSSGPMISITTGVSEPSVCQIGTYTMMVSYNEGSAGGAVTIGIDIATLVLSVQATDVTFDTTGWTTNAIATISPNLAAAVYIHGLSSENKIIFLPFDGPETGGDDGFVYQCNGISLEKGITPSAWITGWSGNDNVFARGYDNALTTVLAENVLCTALISQFDSRNRIAWPATTWNSVGELYLFGRFGDGVALTQIAHSPDSLTTINVVESRWGLDYCSSLRVTPGGSIFAMRNIGSGTPAMIYFGDQSSIIMISRPPQGGAANYHAMAINYVTGQIYVGSLVPQAITISQSRSPYTYWQDITFNHETDKPITSVLIV